MWFSRRARRVESRVASVVSLKTGGPTRVGEESQPESQPDESDSDVRLRGIGQGGVFNGCIPLFCWVLVAVNVRRWTLLVVLRCLRAEEADR